MGINNVCGKSIRPVEKDPDSIAESDVKRGAVNEQDKYDSERHTEDMLLMK